MISSLLHNIFPWIYLSVGVFPRASAVLVLQPYLNTQDVPPQGSKYRFSFTFFLRDKRNRK